MKNAGGGHTAPFFMLTTIVTNHNRGPFLHAALSSIAADRLPDSEIVVVDDGSTDDSICQITPLIGDLGVRIVKLPKRAGFGAARNAGVEASRGEWITFLDSDDLRVPGGISKLLDWLLEHPDENAVMGGAEIVLKGRTDRSIAKYASTWSSEQRIGVQDLRESERLFNLGQVIIHRTLKGEIGSFETCGRGEDRDFFFRLLTRAPLWCLPIPVVRYHIHPENLWNCMRWPTIRRSIATRWLVDRSHECESVAKL